MSSGENVNVVTVHIENYNDLKNYTQNMIEYHLKKELKLTATLAEREMQWVNLMWGLKYSDYKP